MGRSTLNRRVAAIERRLVAISSRCDACGGDGPGGLVFAIAPDEPVPPPPCSKCGRAGNAVGFLITLAEAPAKPAAAA